MKKISQKGTLWVSHGNEKNKPKRNIMGKPRSTEIEGRKNA